MEENKAGKRWIKFTEDVLAKGKHFVKKDKNDKDVEYVSISLQLGTNEDKQYGKITVPVSNVVDAYTFKDGKKDRQLKGIKTVALQSDYDKKVTFTVKTLDEAGRPIYTNRIVKMNGDEIADILERNYKDQKEKEGKTLWLKVNESVIDKEPHSFVHKDKDGNEISTQYVGVSLNVGDGIDANWCKISVPKSKIVDAYNFDEKGNKTTKIEGKKAFPLKSGVKITLNFANDTGKLDENGKKIYQFDTAKLTGEELVGLVHKNQKAFAEKKEAEKAEKEPTKAKSKKDKAMER